MPHPKIADVRSDLKASFTDSTFFGKFKNTGSDNLLVNGSVTPVEFTLEDLPALSKFILQRITFLISADDVIDLNKFGNLAALANGIDFVANGDTPAEAASANIKTNGDTMLISSNVFLESTKITGVTKTVLHGVWDFSKTYGQNPPIIRNNDLKIIINDDLLLGEYFKVSCHGIILE